MTPQEAQIIRDVFAKIRQMGPGPNDPEAVKAVEAELRANPAAALAMVQVIVGLENERAALAGQNAELAQENQALQARQAPQSSGGLFGGAPQVAPQPGPWGQAPAAGPWGQPQPQSQGSGFWGSALRTGAGVAGGLFAFEALRGLFGGHGGGWGGGWGGGPGMASGLFDPGPTIVENVTVIDNGGPYEANSLVDDRSSGLFSDAGSSGGLFSDGGGFGGSGDDWT